MVALISGNLKTFSAIQSNSTAAHTNTLGPFAISNTSFNDSSTGLWLVYLEVLFGVPTAAINEDVFLQDISGSSILQWHVNMGIAPDHGARILIPFTWPGILSFALTGNNQQWSLVTPATTNGPGYSVNMVAYLN